MKSLFKLFLLLPSLALAQSAPVPVMGTAPVQPATAQGGQAKGVPPSPAHIQQRVGAPPAGARAPSEVLPPPSQISRDFYEAISSNNLPLAEMLIQQGADINCRNCGSLTPLMLKMAQYNLDGMRWLIARGADVNLPSPSTDGPRSPLMFASRAAVWDKEMVLMLLQSGAAPNWQNLGGNTAFMVWAERAVIFDHKVEVLAVMLGRGANINQTNNLGQTALMLAIMGSPDCAPQTVQFLLGKGADPTLKSVDGKTAATLAYEQALKGSRACNQVLTMLNGGARPAVGGAVTAPIASGQSAGAVGAAPAQWQGVFKSTYPRNASVSTTATLSPSGETVFSSASGVRATGYLSITGNQVEGTFSAQSPVDADGRPKFQNADGSTVILYKISGTLSNGVMRGNYNSNVESGSFIMCDAQAMQSTPECKTTQVPAGDLLKAVGGLLDTIKGLKN